MVRSPSARSCGEQKTPGESKEEQGGEGKRAARRRGGKKIKNGTLEIWKRARKNRVQNTRELTVNLQSPGREREKKRGEKNGKNVFVEKKQMIEKRVDGGVEHVASSWLLGFLLFLLQQS